MYITYRLMVLIKISFYFLFLKISLYFLKNLALPLFNWSGVLKSLKLHFFKIFYKFIPQKKNPFFTLKKRAKTHLFHYSDQYIINYLKYNLISSINKVSKQVLYLPPLWPARSTIQLPPQFSGNRLQVHEVTESTSCTLSKTIILYALECILQHW